MKSERRHELQHNELADWLIKAGQKLKPYQNYVVAAVAAGAVGFAVYSWWSHDSASRLAVAWTEVGDGLETNNQTILTKVTDDYPDTSAANVAAVVGADWLLADGCNQRFVNKTTAVQQLNTAASSYSLELKESQVPALLERATFGLARASETNGDIEAATKHYQEVVTKWPKGTYAAAAQERLDDFKQPDTKRMFESLRQFDPTASFSEETGPLGPQPNLGTMPEEPQAPPVRKPKTSQPKVEQPKSGQPKAEQPKANAEKKDAEKKPDGTTKAAGEATKK